MHLPHLTGNRFLDRRIREVQLALCLGEWTSRLVIYFTKMSYILSSQAENVIPLKCWYHITNALLGFLLGHKHIEWGELPCQRRTFS
jgi:hypothetical protein